MTNGTEQAGDLTPQDAMHLLETVPDAVLVDVRTQPEWVNVGVPDLGSMDGSPIYLSFLNPPGMTPNPDFVSDLRAELERRGAGTDTPLLFLCRSGARSDAAARTMAAEGFSRCHNVVGGFEGAPAVGRAGWQQSGLPWTRG